MEDRLALLRVNAKKLRTIYGVVAFFGLVGVGGVGAGYATGAKVEGAILGIGMFGVGLFCMGAGMWIYRRVLDAKIVRVLLSDPARIARVFPKETGAAIHGADVTQYTWIVLELADGKRMDIYSPGDDFDGILREIRQCAPDAKIDTRWVRERTNMRLR
jgi:hypothetical protein